jgi:acyl-CoA thioesterase I
MSGSEDTTVECRAWLWAAFIGLALLNPARAEVPAAASALNHAAISAPSARLPAAIPALVAPHAPSTPSAVAPTVRPAALHPAIAPIPPAAAACRAPNALTRFDHPLLRTGRRLAAGEPLTIVAIGSSSTFGAGASSRAASYPSRLAIELQRRFPGRAIIVRNRGVNGEEIPDMMARFSGGVIAARPQLVLWQLGTNSVLRGESLAPHSLELRRGIAELKQAGLDVVLIDPQYAPKVLAKSETPAMVKQIALAAKDEDVDLFPRFAIMRDWYEKQHYSFSVFISPDGLHMNDWGYACWAKLLAIDIAEAANPPVAAVAPQPAR